MFWPTCMRQMHRLGICFKLFLAPCVYIRLLLTASTTMPGLIACVHTSRCLLAVIITEVTAHPTTSLSFRVGPLLVWLVLLMRYGQFAVLVHQIAVSIACKSGFACGAASFATPCKSHASIVIQVSGRHSLICLMMSDCIATTYILQL